MYYIYLYFFIVFIIIIYAIGYRLYNLIINISIKLSFVIATLNFPDSLTSEVGTLPGRLCNFTNLIFVVQGEWQLWTPWT
jgi:hypothetical protein